MQLGNRSVVFNQTFIVPKDEALAFDLTVLGQVIGIEITFPEKPPKAEGPVSWVFSDGKLRMTFGGIAPGVSPSVLRKPFKLGILGHVPFGFLFSVHNVEGSHILHITFLSGGTYDE